ncbi:Gram-positive pilin backbone subunit 2, Cna-B-like domain-containing protein [Bifidobacterium animalis subsp. animalis]|uniref:isopeptide-forming domain-containing fimbrial protein n=1 Tax=Bifidobacterium animalis TaxID=28025 RepID=UPI001021A70D|nr:isopeptide-forming domain-containing fimbrial protein [Bifidobacterium animalis]RYN15137.1 Gram-positive pilin backbone subunit 2, Cna-B-like domain-containing protein [Bifidobacterium animalis subsp. animalis]
MKKVWKGAAAVVAALSLGVTGFVGTSSAYATVTDNGTVTFNNFVEGDEVTAYRILNIESEANGQFVYSVNPDNKAALVAGLNAVKAKGADDFTTETDNSDLVKAATKLTDDNIEDFAKAFKNAGPTAETTKATTNTLSVQQGYYLFDMTKIGQNDKRTKSKYMVYTVGKDGASFNLKNGTVTLEKKVKDNAGDPGNTKDEQGKDLNADWNDSADYAVGDTVPFKLTGTLPDTYDAYKTYYYEFVDTMSTGLTFNKDISVTTNGKDITSCFDTTDGLTSIKAANLKACAVKGADLKAGSEIVVTYSATLNNQAVIGTADNSNTAHLVFSNNPYSQGDGDKGTTPDDTVKVFTYDFKGTKTFSITPNDKDLPKFTLTKDGDTTFKREMQVVKQDDGTYKFSTERIDAGTYTLTETHTPAGFNTAEPITFTISAKHDVTSPDPAVKITVTSDDKVTDKDGQEQDAAIATATGAASTINNTGGSKLPETGGMGTVVLYTVGGLIVLIAGVGLAVALRRRQA